MIPTYPLIWIFQNLNCLFSPFASLSVLEEMADIVVDNDMDMERWWLTKRPPRQFRICKAFDSAGATYNYKGLNSIQGRGHKNLQKFCELVLLLCFNILPALVLDTFQSFHLATTKKTKISNLRFSKISSFANVINSKKQWRSSLWIGVFLNLYFILRKTVLVFSCEQDVFFTNCFLSMLFTLYVKEIKSSFQSCGPNS